MDSELELRSERSREIRASMLNQGFVLRRKDARLCLEPDGSVAWLESLSERRLLFGRESVELHKVQAGIKVKSQKPDWKLTVTPYSASYFGRVFESIDVVQRIEFCELNSTGVVRRVALRNTGGTPIRLLVLSLHDPTTAHFRPDSGEWGAVSVNGFNRTSHVAMDEVADPPSARVIGSLPTPKSIYMTTDRRRAEEMMQAGELPDSTAGMSGQILIVMLQEFDLPAQATREVSTVSLYNSSGLEEALLDFKRSFDARKPRPPQQLMACSSEDLTLAMRWVGPSLEGMEFEEDLLDRVECTAGLPFVDHEAASRIVDSALAEIGRDGFLPHSRLGSSPGRLESAVFLTNASMFALLSGDKKHGKAVYRSLQKLAKSLCAEQPKLANQSPRDLPEGWRRMLGKGCPSGLMSEVVLAKAAALAAAGALAGQIGKPEDSARFVERAELTLDSLRQELVDDKGSMALYEDRSGIVHREETIDQAVGLYRKPFDKRIASSVIHRLQENDFETGYGPRTVPTSNRVYFNGSYGEGQLGGFWTRAALAAAVLSYESGYAGLGSLQLQKIGRLVAEDAVRLGGVPGSFPLWVDIERKVIHGRGSDPVAASRLLEAVVKGELGFSAGARGFRMNPPTSSVLKWLMVAGLWLGEEVSIFVGRSAGSTFTFARCSKVLLDGGTKFTNFEWIQSTGGGVTACMFHGPRQVICAGNNSTKTARSTVFFGPKDVGLLDHLSVVIEELDHASGSWYKFQTARISPSMSLEVSLEPGSWKVLRLSTD